MKHKRLIQLWYLTLFLIPISAFSFEGTCLKPFAIPGKFCCLLDCNPVSACPTENIRNVSLYTEDEYGTQLTLKYGTASNPVPNQSQPVDFPPVNKGTPWKGVSIYLENIEGCTGSNSIATVAPDDWLTAETGNMVGPTKQGVKTLLISIKNENKQNHVGINLTQTSK